MIERAYNKYAVDVIEGKIVCCDSIKLACRRYLADLKRVDLEFRADVVDRAISFIGTMKHFAGEASGKPFILEPWQ
jgi:putative phage terminase, large subunit